MSDLLNYPQNSPSGFDSVHLSGLRNGHPGLTPALGECYAEAAAVCFEHQGHTSGAKLNVSGDYSGLYSIYWDSTTDQVRSSYADLAEATELGAYGLAILLIDQLTDMTIVLRSYKGTGFDYWLARKNNPSPLFQDKTRLEVSGIMKGKDSEIRYRVQKKLTQTDVSDHWRLPALILIIEFSKPCSVMVQK